VCEVVVLAALASFCIIHTSNTALHSMWEWKSWLDTCFCHLCWRNFLVGVTIRNRDLISAFVTSDLIFIAALSW